MDRRNFIKGGCVACLSATGLATLVLSCSPTHYTAGTMGRDGLTLNASEFVFNDRGKKNYRSFIIVRNDVLQYPICVFRLSDTEYSALWMRCTHQGSELQASGDFLHCAAHGSEFNNRGLVRNGPADKNLRNFPVTVSNNQLFIDLRAV